MGEAKRRKTLDPNYGKIKQSTDHIIYKRISIFEFSKIFTEKIGRGVVLSIGKGKQLYWVMHTNIRLTDVDKTLLNRYNHETQVVVSFPINDKYPSGLYATSIFDKNDPVAKGSLLVPFDENNNLIFDEQQVLR